jgi:SulP family sulfate permease
VITGFTNAAALIIIGSQLPAIFGLPLRLDAAAPAAVAAALQKAPAVAATTSAFGLMALALLVVQKRVAPWIPGVLLVCIVGIAVSYAYGFAAIGGGVVGTRS